MTWRARPCSSRRRHPTTCRGSCCRSTAAGSGDEPRCSASLAGHRIVPVHRDRRRRARRRRSPHALDAGGIRCAEITLRTPAGLDAIRAMAQVPGFTVGAGTVLTPDDVDSRAPMPAPVRRSARASTHERRRSPLRAAGIGVLPGVATATEVQRAVRAGLERGQVLPGRSTRRARTDPRARGSVRRAGLRAERRSDAPTRRSSTSPTRRCPRSAAAGWRRASLLRAQRLRRDQPAEPRGDSDRRAVTAT